jgi:hypothetical protein
MAQERNILVLDDPASFEPFAFRLKRLYEGLRIVCCESLPVALSQVMQGQEFSHLVFEPFEVDNVPVVARFLWDVASGIDARGKRITRIIHSTHPIESVVERYNLDRAHYDYDFQKGDVAFLDVFKLG